MVLNALRTFKRLIYRRLSNPIQKREIEQLRLRIAEFERRIGRPTATDREVEQLLQRNAELEEAIDRHPAAINAATVNTLQHSAPEAFFECDFNGVRLLLPRDALRTMTHCIQFQPGSPLRINVETAHSNWLREKLKAGDTFLDVGAATGAMSLPFALSIPNVRTIAFEPSRNTNRLLRAALSRNEVTSVEVRDEAVSDVCGTASFSEVGFDLTGKTPFYPETSAISNRFIDAVHLAAAYEVPVTTLDQFFAGRPDETSVRSIKIDVEGFEILVLRGGQRFLRLVRPYIAIDIHRDPFGAGTTEAGARARLQTIGYRFENMGHVLLCYPPGSS